MHRTLTILTLTAALLAACQPQSVPAQVSPAVTIVAMTGTPVVLVITPTPEPGPDVQPTLSPTPTPKTLTVCMPTEPDTLYEYGSGGSRESIAARAAVLEALRDGPIDHRSFDYQPVILQKLPSLKDGDAAIAAVTVRDGEMIVDSSGSLTPLAAGVRYFDPSGVEQVYSGAGGSVQAMQMTVTFKLLPGLKWEDGAPLTADDALFAWEVLKSPDNMASNHFLTNRANDPVALDDQTIRWTYLPGFKDTLYYTRFPSPLPRHLYGRLTPPQMAADENVNRRPLSYGAFKLDEWVAGDHIALSKNENYFRAAEGLPRLDKLVVRFVPDAAQILAQLISGSCDIGVGAQTSIFDSQIDPLLNAQAQGFLVPQFVASSTFEHLDFNISPAAGYGGLVGSGLFRDVKVRQAFAYCIDRNALIDSVLHGRTEAEASWAYVPVNHPLYAAADLATYAFNPDKGRALLKDAGWEDRNGDGILDKSGLRLSLTYSYGPTGNTLRQSVAQVVQTQLKSNCGIEIKLQELSRADLFGPFPDGVLFGRRFDLGQFAWVADSEPPCGLYTSLEWTGAGDGQPDRYGIATGYPEGGNDVGYHNPMFESACLGAISSLDPAEKQAMHHEAMKIFTQDVPSLMLFLKLKIAAARPNVIGFALDPTQDSELWNAEAFDVAGP